MLHRLAPHRRRQFGGRLEGQRQPAGAQRERSLLECARFGRGDERLEAVERREDQHAAALAELTDDRQAGPVDTQRRDVHPQHLRVVGDGPRLECEQQPSGREELLDRGGRYAAAREIARLVVLVRRQRRDQVREQCIELRRRRNRDGYRLADLRAHRGSGSRVGDADDVGLARRTGRRLRQGVAQPARDGALPVFGHDERLTDDQALRQLQPDHQVWPVGLFPIVDVERGREPAADPLAGRLRAARDATPARSQTSRHTATLPIMPGIIPPRGRGLGAGLTALVVAGCIVDVDVERRDVERPRRVGVRGPDAARRSALRIESR